MASQPATLGRHDLLRWLSDTLHLPPLKVEDCCTGAVHSQLLDSLQPGSVALHKIKWNAKFENEFIQNFKVLQEAFDKHGISRNIPVDKLAKGKYQDNFEFLQWMCQYHRTRASHNGYDALGERLKASKGRDFIAPYSLPQTVDKALSIDVEPTVFRDSSATTTTAHAIKEIPKEAPKVNTVVEETEEQKAQWQNKQTETENMISVYKSLQSEHVNLYRRLGDVLALCRQKNDTSLAESISNLLLRPKAFLPPSVSQIFSSLPASAYPYVGDEPLSVAMTFAQQHQDNFIDDATSTIRPLNVQSTMTVSQNVPFTPAHNGRLNLSIATSPVHALIQTPKAQGRSAASEAIVLHEVSNFILTPMASRHNEKSDISTPAHQTAHKHKRALSQVPADGSIVTPSLNRSKSVTGGKSAVAMYSPYAKLRRQASHTLQSLVAEAVARVKSNRSVAVECLRSLKVHASPLIRQLADVETGDCSESPALIGQVSLEHILQHPFERLHNYGVKHSERLTENMENIAAFVQNQVPLSEYMQQHRDLHVVKPNETKMSILESVFAEAVMSTAKSSSAEVVQPTVTTAAPAVPVASKPARPNASRLEKRTISVLSPIGESNQHVSSSAVDPKPVASTTANPATNPADAKWRLSNMFNQVVAEAEPAVPAQTAPVPAVSAPVVSAPASIPTVASSEPEPPVAVAAVKKRTMGLQKKRYSILEEI